MKTDAERDLTLDILKGLMIIAVVVGHIAFILTNGDIEHNVPFLFCYSWHMYCFMIVIGYVAKKYSSLNRDGAVLKRIKRLIYPWVIWSVARTLFMGDFEVTKIISNLFVDPIYWFLIVQFLYEMVVFVALKLKHTIVTFVLATLVMALAYYIFKTEMTRQILLHWPYYCIGYYLGGKSKSIRPRWALLFIPLYFASMFFYSFTDRTRVDDIVHNILSGISVPEKMINRVVTLMDHGGWQLYNYAIVAILGSACYYFLALVINNSRFHIGKYVLSELGKRTLQIYLLSGFLYVSCLSNSLNWIVSLILCIGVPIVVDWITSKNARIHKVFFGV